LRVSEIALPGVAFGSDAVPEAEARRIFEVYAESGGNFIDTAHAYGEGRSERIVGDLIKADRDHFVVATKYGMAERPGSIAKAGTSRKNMRRCVDESLRRLSTEAIDVLYLHIWDYTTGWDEILSTMDALVRDGKVHYVAVADTPAWQISRAVTISELRGWSPFVGVLLRYSLADRTAERDLLPMARELDLGVIAWGPLAGAVPSGGRPIGAGNAVNDVTLSATETRAASVLGEVAREVGGTPAQIALAWMRTRSQRFGGIFPLVGAESAREMHGYLASSELSLDPGQLARLNEETSVDLGYPQDFLDSDRWRNMTTAYNPYLLDNHRHPSGR
jgi:aryl-alcohol dehydrogenase-like predicted oxidoreductase